MHRFIIEIVGSYQKIFEKTISKENIPEWTRHGTRSKYMKWLIWFKLTFESLENFIIIINITIVSIISIIHK